MISQHTIDRIHETVRIEDVVGDHVKLKRAGSNLQGRCPFHDEKTPSFMVSPRRNTYKCFGCGEGGDSISFVMKYLHKSYPEALRQLADRYHIEVDEDRPDPEREKKIKVRASIYDFNAKVAALFAQLLYLPDHTEALNYIRGRFTDNTLKSWQVGYAPKGYNRLFSWAKSQGYTDDFLLSTGLVRKSSKNEKIYDFFQDRIIFPIADQNNNIISFAGRSMPDSDTKAKYINLPETEAYHKSDVLYGLNLAIGTITKTRVSILVEGNPDVIRMHETGITNTVAPSGTALAEGQISLLKRYSEKIILLYDGDNAGQKALLKNGKLLVEKGLIPYAAILPEGEDPDSFFKDPEEAEKWIDENKQDFINYYASGLFRKIGNDPELKNEAINQVCDLLFHLSDIKKQLYLELFTKESKIKGKLFTDRLKELEAQNTRVEDRDPTLPEDVDANEFEKWGFYEYKNAYYFRTKSGTEKLSNFLMKPVFHINSIMDSKRIFELVNEFGFRVVVNLDMNEMTSLQGFQRNVESKGNFMFWGQMGHFQKLKLKLYEETRTCDEIKNLGWQREGFWSWANGKLNEDGSFEEIDEYGVVRHNEKDYFIPAFSKIYMSDKSIFIDERKFQYRESNLALREWMELYTRVHGENSMVAFAWYLSALFRDHILYLNDNFPLLNLFGQKGSGKNTLAYSLLSLFGKKQTEYNLHNGTKAGLAKHLEMFRNAIAFVDEYKNNLPFEMIETLKSIYNSIGRSRLNMDKGGQKETTEVNQGVIVAGQEMPTVDVALSSRMIYLQFLTKEGLTEKQKSDFEKLQQIERDGLPHFTAEFLSHRKYFIEHYKVNYDAVMRDLLADTEEDEMNDRILRNMCTVVAAFRTLEHRFHFTFTYNQLLREGINCIKDHNRQLKQSDEIGVFWNMLEAMFDDDLLIDKWHFHVKMVNTLNLKEGGKDFPEGKLVLKFKFNAVAKLYAEQLRRRGEKPLPQDSLQHYLKTNRHFIGIEKACKYIRKEYKPGDGGIVESKQTTTAFCFDYEPLGINLERQAIEDNTNPYNRVNGYDTDPDPVPEQPQVVQQELPY